MLKIRREFICITIDGATGKVIKLGEYVTLVFYDGTYHSGEIISITDEHITIQRSDGSYTYRILSILEIKQ